MVVSAVGAGDKFSECFVTREPGFQIILLGCCIVQFARDDIDNLIRKFEALVELFRG